MIDFRSRLVARLMIVFLSVPRRSRCFVFRGLSAFTNINTNTLHGSTTSTSTSTSTRRTRCKIMNTPSRLFSFDDLLGDVERLIAEDAEPSPPSQDGPSSSSSDEEWKQVDWERVTLRDVKPSPVEELFIQGRRVFIKRDDLLRLPGSQISGNKARKMLALNDMDDFPACLVSYGGPQSNSMLALAAICNYKGRDSEPPLGTQEVPQPTTRDKQQQEQQQQQQQQQHRFIYYTKTLPRFLRKQPSGNFFRAKSLGMEIKEVSHEEYKDLFGGEWGGNSNAPIGLAPPIPKNSLWVPQGGACPMAEKGVQVLAREIATFWSLNGEGKPLSVCVPGGTCATAVLLHHQLKGLMEKNKTDDDIQVVVVPCVGDAAYSRRQMMSLSSQIGAAAEDIPAILLPDPCTDFDDQPKKYFNFAEPNKDILDTFGMFRDKHDISLDLIYGAPAWTIMLRHWNVESRYDAQFDPNNPLAGREVMYVHSGGLEGINSQLLRYKHKGLIDIDDIQLPGRGQT